MWTLSTLFTYFTASKRMPPTEYIPSISGTPCDAGVHRRKTESTGSRKSIRVCCCCCFSPRLSQTRFSGNIRYPGVRLFSVGIACCHVGLVDGLQSSLLTTEVQRACGCTLRAVWLRYSQPVFVVVVVIFNLCAVCRFMGAAIFGLPFFFFFFFFSRLFT